MFVDRIDGVDAKEVKRVFKELITAYMNPAYGSMSKSCLLYTSDAADEL